MDTKQERRLVRAIAHELGNLLSVIALASGDLDALRDDPREPPIQSASSVGGRGDDGGGAGDGAPREAKQVAFARAQVLLRRLRREPGEPRSIDLCRSLDDSRALLAVVAPGAGRLRIERPDEPLFVRARPEDVEIVLFNLVDNAAVAVADTSGTVTVSAQVVEHEGSSRVRLRVLDQGRGIEPAIAERVFDEGFTTRGSTGLGLTLVRETVEGLGGSLVLGSCPNGTCVDVLFPA